MSIDPARLPSASLPRHGLLALLVAVLLFAAVAPTLPWLEFSSGSENLLAATVVEMHAGSPWLLPSLNGEPRVRKPPLPAWVAAALVPRSIIADLDSPDDAFRHAAYRRFAWALRWPPLLMSCLIVLATYELGRTLVDARFGLLACVVCASSLLLLRYGRSATTDIHLALWVTATNLCLTKVIFQSRTWPFLPLAGFAAGLAFMSKGPVGLAQSVLPVITFLVAQRLIARNQSPLTSRSLSRYRSFGMTTAALGVFIAVAAPWFVYVLRTVPDAWAVFKTEVTRDGATTLAADPWHNYFVIVALAAPWVVFFIAGVAVCAVEWRRSPHKLFAVLLLIAPIVVMSLVKDKNERYLLPMIAPLALVTAYAILPQLRPRMALNATEMWLARAHACVLLALAAGLPLVMSNARWLPRLDGGAWLPGNIAVIASAIGAGVWAIAIVAWRRSPVTMIASTLCIMLTAHALFLYGYRESPRGRSQMLGIADAIHAVRPSATVYYVDTDDSPKAIPQDLQIYLNRAVRTVYKVDDMPAPSSDRVLVMLRREGEDAPTIPGWIELARRPWGGRSWNALVGP